MLKIYAVHPISGLSADDVFAYYKKTQQILTDVGYDVFIPMFGKGNLRTEMKFKASDYRSPLSTNHAIYARDHWMVSQADIIYANFLGAKIVSISSMFELAWASHMNKQVIIVMEKENIMQHAFVLESATILLETEEEAIDYLTKLSKKDY